MGEVILRFVFCCILYTCVEALPTPEESRISSQSHENTAIVEQRNYGGEARQGAILAALGAALIPFIASIFAPLLSQLAGMVSSAVLGKLQAGAERNTTSPLNYDAYMINMPDQPGPYLFLTAATKDPDNSDTRKPTLVRKTPKISHHLGTVNIKSNVDGPVDAARTFSREMRIPVPHSDLTERLDHTK